jgi:hypothetical protein
LNLSEIASRALALSGNPKLDGGLEGQLYELLSLVLNSLYVDCKVGDQNIFVEPINWSPTSNDVELAEQGITPTSVSLIYDETNDYRAPIRIVDLNEVDRYQAEGKLCVAFYGTPQRARFTWNPADDSDELVLWFERAQPGPTQKTSTPNIPADHHDLIALRLGALLRENVLDKPLTASLRYELARAEEQWKVFCKGSREQRPIQRSRYSDARGYN